MFRIIQLALTLLRLPLMRPEVDIYMAGMFVTKLMMTQAIAADGKVRAVTIVRAEPNVITQIKTPERDGYFALQLGLPSAKLPTKGRAARWRRRGEFIYPEGEYQIGGTLTAEMFAVGDKVKVMGINKGHGFAGTVKRHQFHRGPMTHGHDHHRAPGSIGAMGMPKVAKGMRMAGHLGDKRTTVRGLTVAAVDTKNQLLAITGAVPGPIRSVLTIEKYG